MRTVFCGLLLLSGCYGDRGEDSHNTHFSRGENTRDASVLDEEDASDKTVECGTVENTEFECCPVAWEVGASCDQPDTRCWTACLEVRGQASRGQLSCSPDDKVIEAGKGLFDCHLER